jgi:hypothetical protein
MKGIVAPLSRRVRVLKTDVLPTPSSDEIMMAYFSISMKSKTDL